MLAKTSSAATEQQSDAHKAVKLRSSSLTRKGAGNKSFGVRRFCVASQPDKCFLVEVKTGKVYGPEGGTADYIDAIALEKAPPALIDPNLSGHLPQALALLVQHLHIKERGWCCAMTPCTTPQGSMLHCEG